MNFPQFNAFYSCESAETAEKTVEDIDWLFKTYKGYMYARLQEMFTYKNLPESIPAEMLEYYLLSGGVSFVTKVLVKRPNRRENSAIFAQNTVFLPLCP